MLVSCRYRDLTTAAQGDNLFMSCVSELVLETREVGELTSLSERDAYGYRTIPSQLGLGLWVRV